MKTTDRAQIRIKQDRILAIANRRDFPRDIPISSLQQGAPTLDDLCNAIYPDFEPCLDSFLSEFDHN